MHAPRDVDGQLGRLRTRQEHGEIEGAQEEWLGDPALLVDELAVHDRDLPGRTAEVDEAKLEPETERLGETDALPPIFRARSGWLHAERQLWRRSGRSAVSHQ